MTILDLQRSGEEFYKLIASHKELTKANGTYDDHYDFYGYMDTSCQILRNGADGLADDVKIRINK
jgi:hypothetical protein